MSRYSAWLYAARRKSRAANQQNMKCVSVVICTYKRPGTLDQALQSVFDQTLVPSTTIEIIVVDNCPQEATRAVVERYQRMARFPIRYVAEAREGVSFARNTGIESARGDIIAYLDDDEIAAPDWLEGMLQVYRLYPDAAAVTGKVEPIWEIQPPAWFDDGFRLSVSIGGWGEEIKRLCYPHGWIWVGNSSFRRTVFTEIGMFDTRLGRRGKRQSAGEETDLQCRIERAGGHIYYTPKALIQHHVPKERLTLDYYSRIWYGAGRAHYSLDQRYQGYVCVLKKAMELVIKSPVRLIALVVARYTRDTRTVWARSGLLKFAQGYVGEILRARWSKE